MVLEGVWLQKSVLTEWPLPVWCSAWLPVQIEGPTTVTDEVPNVAMAGRIGTGSAGKGRIDRG